MIDRALESCSTPYIVAMRNLLFFFDELCSSIRNRDSLSVGDIVYAARFYRKSIIDRALESDCAPYKLAMRILLFFDELCSSIRS